MITRTASKHRYSHNMYLLGPCLGLDIIILEFREVKQRDPSTLNRQESWICISALLLTRQEASGRHLRLFATVGYERDRWASPCPSRFLMS